MKKLKVICFLLGLVISCSVDAQTDIFLLHEKTMRLIVPEFNAALINVYDVNNEKLLRSINSHARYLSVSSDNKKIFAIDTNSATIIDILTLDAKQIKLESARGERPYYIIPLGINEKGIAIVEYAYHNKIDCIVYNIAKGGQKVNTLTFSRSANPYFKGYNIYITDKESTISIVNPLTGESIKKISGACDPVDLAEAKQYDSSNFMYRILYVGSNYFVTQLSWAVSGKNTSSLFLFDVNRSLIVTKVRATGMASLLERPNAFDTGSDPLFYKTTQKIPMPELDLPELIDPTNTKLKGRKLAKASKENLEKTISQSQKYYDALAAYKSEDNYYTTTIYSDINCNKVILSVARARSVSMQNGYLLFWKDASIEVYDFKTGKLLHTIYRV